MKYSPWITESIRLLSVMVIALLLGLALSQIWVCLTLCLALLMGWHGFHAFRLMNKLNTRSAGSVDIFPSGLWRELWLRLNALDQSRRRQKKKVSRFFKRFRGASLAFPNATLLVERSNRIEWFNPAASRLLGIGWPEARGRDLTDLLSAPEVTGYLRRGDFSHPLEFTPTNNNSVILSMLVTPFGKRKHQRLIVLTDITRLANLDRTRRDFVANASHEFRTPLTVIFGYLEALAEDNETPESWRRPLELMQQQTLRMRNIVNDLLILSRLETDPSNPDRQPINVPRLLREICDDVAGMATDSGHSVHTEIDQDLWLRGAHEELQSIFSNLLYNAIQHTPEGTDIWIRWQRQAQGPQFSVQDNGAGIEERYIPRLTERFFRVDKARSRETGGTGLGLAIVKQIVQRYDGRLEIHSTPKTGSTFSCIFPQSLALQPTSDRTEAGR